MSADWVHASRSPLLPGLNVHASAATPGVFMLVYFSWETFFLCLATIVFMVVLRLKGRSFTWLMRRTKSRLRGQQVQARPLWYRRRFSRIESFDLVMIQDVVQVQDGL